MEHYEIKVDTTNCEVISCDDCCKVTLLSERVVCEFTGRRHIETYWDSHGKLVKWHEGQWHYRSGEFKVIEKVYRYDWKYCDTTTETSWTLYINGEKFEGEVYEVLKTKIKIVQGWG